MGAGQSIFYPDNPKRRTRAEELSNDCKYAQQQYEASKAAIERELGPYKEKMEYVLRAFDCRNIEDFDRYVQRTATGEALNHWYRVRESYDKSQMIDQVLMVAEGVVTAVGFTVSVIGAAAGGFGFFAGLAVTADILLVLGLIGAIIDIIEGAIQREKLRDAINQLVPARLKARYAAKQMQEIEKCIPSIKLIYRTLERAHYDRDQIIQIMREGGDLDSLKKSQQKVTYYSVGEELSHQDSGRRSWTKEDPAWWWIAFELDNKASRTNLVSSSQDALAAKAASRMETEKELMPSDEKTLSDGCISLKLDMDGVGAIFDHQIQVKLQQFEGDDAARVLLHAENGNDSFVANFDSETVQVKPASEASDSTTWLLSFVKSGDAQKFSTAGKSFSISHIPRIAEVYLRSGDMYLTKEGGLSHQLSSLLVSYA